LLRTGTTMKMNQYNIVVLRNSKSAANKFTFLLI
jgi:hypothetical protein